MRCGGSYVMHKSVGVRASEQGRPGNLIDRLDSRTKNLVENVYIYHYASLSTILSMKTAPP